jgi:hypothetical protein
MVEGKSFLLSAVLYNVIFVIHFFRRCDFKKQFETLTNGYCKGGNCKLEGDDHPDFSSHVSY